MVEISRKQFRRRRSIAAFFVFLLIISLQFVLSNYQIESQKTQPNEDVLSEVEEKSEVASEVLERLEVKGRAPKTGYSRAEFGDGWAEVSGCDMRNIILQRSMRDSKIGSDGCIVVSGTLADVYTGLEINFIRGADTSDMVQIDHVVALSDAWQKGAQNITPELRVRFANDPLNLLAVDGPANQEKGDSDAASWLPPNRAFRCQYVARQIAVKAKYNLWVTEAEFATMRRVLQGCGDQRVPVEL